MINLLLIGHLGNDATVNNVNGKNVINFNVCHTETYKDQQGVKVNKSIWVSCSYWTDKTAVAPYLKKGTQVYVEGTPEVSTYLKDNQVIPQQKLRVFNIQLLSSNQNSQQESSEKSFEKHLGNHKTEF